MEDKEGREEGDVQCVRLRLVDFAVHMKYEKGRSGVVGTIGGVYRQSWIDFPVRSSAASHRYSGN